MKKIFSIYLLFVSLFFPAFAQKVAVWPPSGWVGIEDSVSFQWNSVSYTGNNYTFQLSDDSLFTNLIYNFTTTATDTTLFLPSYSQYYWKIDNGTISETSYLIKLNVLSIDSVIGWFIADSISSAINSNISLWKNLATDTMSLIQSTTIQQPLLIKNEYLANHNVVFTDGINDNMKSSKIDVRVPYNYFLVIKFHENGYFFDGNQSSGRHLMTVNNNIYHYSGSWVHSSPIDTSLAFFLNIENKGFKTDILINNNIDGSGVSGNFNSGGITLGSHSNGGYSSISIAELIIINDSLSDSLQTLIYKYLQYKYAPPVNLGQDIFNTTFCDTLLQPSRRFVSYQWSSGSTDTAITVSQAGTYMLTATDIFGFTSIDSVQVFYPYNELPEDTVEICQGDTFTWNTYLSHSLYTFSWNNNTSDSLLKINTQGTYQLTITDNQGCNYVTKPLTVLIDSFPTQATLGNDTAICAGNTISLQSGGNNAVSYIWNTGSTLPEITITNSGLYTLTVTNNLGCVAYDSINITIKGIAPNTYFSFQNVCLNDSTYFIDLSTVNDLSNIISRNWYIDNLYQSSDSVFNYLFSDTGNYKITLWVTTDSGCASNYIDTLHIYPLPSIDFTISSLPFCSGKNLLFTGNTSISEGYINSWYWNYGDNFSSNNTSSFQNGNHLYTQSGNYTVTYAAVSDVGCSDTIRKTVEIYPSPIADFFPYTNTGLCPDISVTFQPNATGDIVSYFWQFDNLATSTNPYPAMAFPDSGNYDITLQVTDYQGCSDDSTKTIHINANPVAGYDRTDFCIGTPVTVNDTSVSYHGNIVQWQWSFLNAPDKYYTPSVTLNFSTSVTDELQLKVTTDLGCSDSVSFPVVLHSSPFADFSFSPSYGAPPLEVNFTNYSTGSTSFLWNFGDSSYTTEENPTHTFNELGSYSVVLYSYNTYDCYDSSIKTIKVLYPFIDVAVVNAYTDFDQTIYLSLSASLKNYSNVQITSFDIKAETSGGISIKEHWEGNWEINETITYQFHSSIEIPSGELPDYICVEIFNPNNQPDSVSENNKFCLALNKFQIFSPYPNPATEQALFTYMVPEKATVNISIFNAQGQQILSELIDANKGVNTWIFDTRLLAKGIYHCKIIYKDQLQTVSFMKK